MLHCWENLETKPTVMITAVVLNSWSFYSAMWGEKGKYHQIIFDSITSSPTTVQVCASEAKTSRVPPLFPVMREIDCHCQHFLVFFFFLSLRNTVLRNKSRAQVYQKWCRYDSSALQNTVWEKLYSWESEPNTNAAKCIFRITLTRPFIFVFVVSLLWVVLGSPRCVLSWQAASLMARGSQLFCQKNSRNSSRWKQ